MRDGLLASHRSRRLAGAVAAALAVALVAAAPAAAAPSGGLSIAAEGTGGGLRLDGEPGGMVRGAVRVSNLSRRAMTVRLQAADIGNAANGGADFRTGTLARAGRWLTLSANEVRLAPRSSRRVGFTARVPAGAAGGSHYAGVVAIDAADLAPPPARKAAEGEQTGTIQRINRMAVPVSIRLPGPVRRSLALSGAALDVRAGQTTLRLGLRPGGTAFLPGARIRLRVVRDGRTVFGHRAGLGQMVPGSAIDYGIPWRGRPTEGEYRIVGEIRPEGAPVVRIDERVAFTPEIAERLEREGVAVTRSAIPSWIWIVLAAAAVLIVVAPLTAWKLARRSGTLVTSR